MFKPQALRSFFAIAILATACCMEQNDNSRWEIINNTGETVFIKFANAPFPDSFAIEPLDTFIQLNSHSGKNTHFTCNRPFPEGQVQVTVSNDKFIRKDIYVQGNWITSDQDDDCTLTHKCTFAVDTVDIE